MGEISERVEATANKIFKTIQGNHKAIADNYLSLKAYAVTAHSLVKAYVIKGKGKNLSSMGDLLNEYSAVCNGVRMRNPMGLGKYLLMKAKASMMGKGILQVDKVEGHAGNWVFVNGRAIGLSNKLKDFESLAVRMAHYEGTLAKLTASLSGKVKRIRLRSPYKVAPPEYQGK